MHIITKIVQLLGPDLPVIPSGPGTFLIVDARQGQMFGIGGGTLATGVGSVELDWGDGERQTFAEDFEHIEHTYAKPGYYLVSITDGLDTFGVGSLTEERFLSQYTRMVLKAVSRGRLERIRTRGFQDAVFLTRADFAQTSLNAIIGRVFAGCSRLATFPELPPTVYKLASACFQNCSSLTGRIDLPGVNSIVGASGEKLPFLGCDGITEIHFAAANEQAIKGSTAWGSDPKLGAANATILFDL